MKVNKALLVQRLKEKKAEAEERNRQAEAKWSKRVEEWKAKAPAQYAKAVASYSPTGSSTYYQIETKVGVEPPRKPMAERTVGIDRALARLSVIEGEEITLSKRSLDDIINLI